jgi:predicted metal-dependent HD superfamily phosphohydrolase
MRWPSEDRWIALWRQSGIESPPRGWYERLTTAYAEPQRHYHTQQHIGECLASFDECRNLAPCEPVAVELALWFHDAVYDPKLPDNEEKSAALAAECLAETSVSVAVRDTVPRLVRATKQHRASGDPDAEVVINIDLSVLGQAEPRFLQYENQIRQEYAWVPAAIFAAKRAEILERFLDRERIFTLDWFWTRFERQARQNLSASIQALRQR